MAQSKGGRRSSGSRASRSAASRSGGTTRRSGSRSTSSRGGRTNRRTSAATRSNKSRSKSRSSKPRGSAPRARSSRGASQRGGSTRARQQPGSMGGRRNTSRGSAQDAVSLLAQDHRNVEKLFKRAQKDPSVFDQIREELELHAQVEEEIFYPAVEEALSDEGGDDLVEEARREHQEVKDLLAELASLDRQGSEFEQKLQKLQDDVEHHVEEDEGEMFKKTRRAIPKAGLIALGAQMEARKEDLRAATARS
jgi:hypothetical protein